MSDQLEKLPLAPTPAQFLAADISRNKAKADPAEYQRKLDKLTSEESMLRLLREAV